MGLDDTAAHRDSSTKTRIPFNPYDWIERASEHFLVHWRGLLQFYMRWPARSCRPAWRHVLHCARATRASPPPRHSEFRTLPYYKCARTCSSGCTGLIHVTWIPLSDLVFATLRFELIKNFLHASSRFGDGFKIPFELPMLSIEVMVA